MITNYRRPCLIDKTDEKSITEYGTVESMKQQFTWAEIQSITNNFERVLGKGGFGTIYHGYINNDTQVAVKVLSASSFRGYQQFHAEVCMQSKLAVLTNVYAFLKW